MKIPNADRAVVAKDKLREYLLNLAHRRGGPKAKLLLSMGYRAEDWQKLDADIRANHLPSEVDRQTDTAYGIRYEVVAPLCGSGGVPVIFRSIWQIDTGTDYPRFITMYPE